MAAIIELKSLYKTFGAGENQVNALKNVSVSVEKGDVFGIIGLSGAGKSTLVRCINLLERPDRGSVLFDGQNLMELKEKELRAQMCIRDRLYTHFRKLIRDNNELIDLRRRMEIKHLESQFNPHFVFNVMETIRFQMEQDPKEASRMLRSFASLMRYSIHYGDTKVPLETDVEYVNDYLLLQKARYNNCCLLYTSRCV